MKIESIPAIEIEPIPRHEKKASSERSSNGKKFKVYMKLGLLLIAIMVFLKFDAISDYYTVQTYDGSREMVTLANEAGLNLKGKALFLSKSPDMVTANQLYKHCPRKNGTLGCYVPGDNKIYILKISGRPYSLNVPSTIAHEMLHVAWMEMSSSQRQSVSANIEKQLDNKTDSGTKSIKKILATYDKDKDIQINEAHSFIGSEVAEDRLSNTLNEHYSKYFSDRKKSVRANAEYNKGIEGIEKSLKKRTAVLRTQLKDIDKYESKWLTPFDRAFEQNMYYGDYRTYNKNVKAYNSNLETYKNLVSDYEAERISLNSDINDYNSAMKAMLADEQIKNIKKNK